MSATADTNHSPTSSSRDLASAPWVAVAAIAVTSVATALLSPDMVSGSEHEHLPLAALAVWPWSAAAAAYVVMASRRGGSRQLVLGTSALWVLVALVCIAAPVLVTGTDPTRIPLAALLAPPAGAIVTGFLAVDHAVVGWSRAAGQRETR
jgi:hypothetical protein